jgi:hypothetical protein
LPALPNRRRGTQIEIAADRGEKLTSRALLLLKMVADAVVVEPVSDAKFPANREKSREYRDFQLFLRSEAAKEPMVLGP